MNRTIILSPSILGVAALLLAGGAVYYHYSGPPKDPVDLARYCRAKAADVLAKQGVVVAEAAVPFQSILQTKVCAGVDEQALTAGFVQLAQSEATARKP